jgi:hypothetical protein
MSEADATITTSPPTSVEKYESEEDMFDCELVCADGHVVKTSRYLLRVIPWFRNAFRLHKTLPVKLDLANYPSSVVQKVVDFCAPTMTLQTGNKHLVPLKSEVYDYLKLTEMLMMHEKSLSSNVFHTFRTIVLNPIGNLIDRQLLVDKTDDCNDDGNDQAQSLGEESSSESVKVLTPHLVHYLFSHIDYDGWPSYLSQVSEQGMLAIARSGIPLRTIIGTYSGSTHLYFTDEFRSVYEGPQHVSDLVPRLKFSPSEDFTALVHRLVSVGLRPLISLVDGLGEQASSFKMGSFGWRLGWPLNLQAIEKRPAFKKFLDSLLQSEHLTKAEAMQVRELACIVDDCMDVKTNWVIPHQEIAAVLGYRFVEQHMSSVLANPCGDGAETIHDLIDVFKDNRKFLIVNHLKKHGLLDKHRIAVGYFPRQ